MAYKSKILFKEFVTHDVKRFIIEKPSGFTFVPGQATNISLNQPEWIGKKRDFTFTSKNEDLVLEFTIKGYPDHNGVTKELQASNPGTELLLEDPFGTIHYKGAGIFLAAGAGITPFIAILRHLRDTNALKGNTLIFSNKEKKDIILEKEFRDMFKADDAKVVFVLSREEVTGYEFGRIDETLLKKHVLDMHKNFYLCGPDAFVAAMKELVVKLDGSPESIVFEE